MSEPVSQVQFYDAVRELHATLLAQHKSIRATVEDRCDRIEEKVDVHTKEDNAVERRVTILETKWEGEERRSVKIGTWAGILGAFGLTAVWEIVKAKAGW